MKMLLALSLTLTTFTAFAQQNISPGLRLVFQASNLSKHRLDNNICDTNAYQSEINNRLKEALRLEPSLLSRIKGDPKIMKAMRDNLTFHEIIGNLGPKLEGLEDVLGKAEFESNSGGVYGPALVVEFKKDGRTIHTIMEWKEGQDMPTHRKAVGSWKVVSKSGATAKVDVNGEEYTLKKIKAYEDHKEFILEDKSDEQNEFKNNSLWNTKSECSA